MIQNLPRARMNERKLIDRLQVTRLFLLQKEPLPVQNTTRSGYILRREKNYL